MKLTQPDIIIRHLADCRDWQPTHALQGINTRHGFIGSAGAVRVRELARNDCGDRHKDLVERARGAEIGLDPRYEYFRARSRADSMTTGQ